MLDILVPVLDRPAAVEPLLRSIERATNVPHRVLFIADPDDDAEIRALEDAGAEFIVFRGGYASKINYGVRQTSQPLLFFGADDLRFHPGWFTTACWRLLTPGVEVVGVNDVCSKRVRRGQHATHFLVKRRYAFAPTIDDQEGPLSERYFHWFVDDEFVGTAQARGVIEFAQDSIVEHLHYMNGKAEVDRTYERGREYARVDLKRYNRRKWMWETP